MRVFLITFFDVEFWLEGRMAQVEIARVIIALHG